jgi:peptide/nickel transport system substrate-binding protein
MIADTLKRNGFNIYVRELPWESYLDALKTGHFDMYYGEVVLSADFDLSPLLLPGNLNYGKTASSDYLPLLEDFLLARSDYEVRYAAKHLCDEILMKVPFAPVLYKRYAIYFPMGAISGADPSPSGVFRNFTNWKIDLDLLT